MTMRAIPQKHASRLDRTYPLFTMNRVFAIFLTTVTMAFATTLQGDDNPPTTVARVDLDRYSGLWYEIAKIPNRFQDQCVSDTTAEYALREDGRIDVVNRCITVAGDPDEAQGVARIVDADTQARLEVSFVSLFGWYLFWGDYWVLGLAEDYAYSVVGHPERRYGWILSRTPTLDDEKLQHVRNLLSEQGYDPEDFEVTPQSAAR